MVTHPTGSSGGVFSKDLTLKLRPTRKDIVSNSQSLWKQFVLRPRDQKEFPAFKQMRANQCGPSQGENKRMVLGGVREEVGF